jgi:DNA uptake protein ComE-like DNA-binding protein
MYRLYRWIYNLLGFSRSQTNGFLLFLPLVILFLASEPVYRRWRAARVEDNSSDQKVLDSLIAAWPILPNDVLHAHPQTTATTPVDPNTASMTELTAIGLPERLAGRIISYRNKGGTFNAHSDLLKIYGMDSLLLANIRSLLTFPPKAGKPRELREPRKVFKAIEVEAFDINAADSVTLKKIRGIGDKLAMRIIKYRDALGGFVSMDQLSEIYRLDSVVVKELKRKSFIRKGFVPKVIELNTVDGKTLSSHPYFNRNEAEAIVTYRFKHGKFQTPADLRKVRSLDSAQINKIIPYLKIE